MTAALVEPAPKSGLERIPKYVGGASAAEGHANPVKLSANENILGCSPQAHAAFSDTGARLHIYPDGASGSLRAALAARHGLDANRIVCGAGSDEVLGLVSNAYLRPGDNTVQGEHAYLCYRILTMAAMAEPRFAKEPSFKVDVDEILSLVDERTKIVFIANPANPTGSWLKGAEIRRLHGRLPPSVILVLDGAYADYVDDPDYENGMELAHSASNVIVTQTFSKIHGLAALRVGWAYAPASIADILNRVRPPFNVSAPAQAAACASLADEAFIRKSRELILVGRARLTADLTALGLVVTPSATNFIMVRFPQGAEASGRAEAELRQRGLLVRNLDQYQLSDCLRITVGQSKHNDDIVSLLEELYMRGDL